MEINDYNVKKKKLLGKFEILSKVPELSQKKRIFINKSAVKIIIKQLCFHIETLNKFDLSYGKLV